MVRGGAESTADVTDWFHPGLLTRRTAVLAAACRRWRDWRPAVAVPVRRLPLEQRPAGPRNPCRSPPSAAATALVASVFATPPRCGRNRSGAARRQTVVWACAWVSSWGMLRGAGGHAISIRESHLGGLDIDDEAARVAQFQRPDARLARQAGAPAQHRFEVAELFHLLDDRQV